MSADDRALSGRQPKAVTSALRVLEEVARAGSGLQGMADRLGAVGGTLSVTSAPGHGTTVQGSVPLTATAAPVEGTGGGGPAPIDGVGPGGAEGSEPGRPS